MDFWTSFPYVGIIILVIINALLVQRQEVIIEDDESIDTSL